ncbi:hypothetical protein [Nostoc sp. UCD120]|uniref:hypothetical protein n=1 Tax=Nostoc sp. UCD120 TaxID=2681312 RepID=UPI0021AB707F|nr:hypothetical protein [Nostoc sp. UCD120]
MHGYNTREIQDFLGHRDIKHAEKYTLLKKSLQHSRGCVGAIALMFTREYHGVK